MCFKFASDDEKKVAFQYSANKDEQKAALNFHLTKREEKYILSSVNSLTNQENFKKLMEIFNKKYTPAPSAADTMRSIFGGW
jgi:hypothetical protein